MSRRRQPKPRSWNIAVGRITGNNHAAMPATIRLNGLQGHEEAGGIQPVRTQQHGKLFALFIAGISEAEGIIR